MAERVILFNDFGNARTNNTRDSNMKTFILNLIMRARILLPVVKFILKSQEANLVKLINEKYDKKGMTEEEEAKAIKEILDKLISLM